MSFISIAKAVLYRETVWIRRFLPEYVVLWTISLLFSASVVFLPATLSDISTVCRRFSELVGHSLALEDALALSICVSSIIALVASIVNDIVQTMYNEARVIGVLNTILETTSIARYTTASTLVRSVITSILSTLYLAPSLALVKGLDGLALYLYMAPALIVSGIAIAFYSLTIGVVLTFYSRISRPWTVTNTLVPALLAGSGLYIPITLVPIALRAFAYTSPVPLANEVAKTIALVGYTPRLALTMLIITALTCLYLSISTTVSLRTDKAIRRGGG